MAKISDDRTTLDLFVTERRIGRPRTNPYPRSVQLRINKRNQIQRDQQRGRKRVEVKLAEHQLAKLDQLAQQQGISRSALIAMMIEQRLASDSVNE